MLILHALCFLTGGLVLAAASRLEKPHVIKPARPDLVSKELHRTSKCVKFQLRCEVPRYSPRPDRFIFLQHGQEVKDSRSDELSVKLTRSSGPQKYTCITVLKGCRSVPSRQVILVFGKGTSPRHPRSRSKSRSKSGSRSRSFSNRKRKSRSGKSGSGSKSRSGRKHRARVRRSNGGTSKSKSGSKSGSKRGSNLVHLLTKKLHFGRFGGSGSGRRRSGSGSGRRGSRRSGKKRRGSGKSGSKSGSGKSRSGSGRKRSGRSWGSRH